MTPIDAMDFQASGFALAVASAAVTGIGIAELFLGGPAWPVTIPGALGMLGGFLLRRHGKSHEPE